MLTIAFEFKTETNTEDKQELLARVCTWPSVIGATRAWPLVETEDGRLTEVFMVYVQDHEGLTVTERLGRETRVASVFQAARRGQV